MKLNNNKSLTARLLQLEELILTRPDTGLAAYCIFLSEDDISRDENGRVSRLKEGVSVPKGHKVYVGVDIDRV
jgi:hypothetical protein